MAKSGGVNPKDAKKAWKKVDAILPTLDKKLEALKELVEAMNANNWYGGTRANAWYAKMQELFASLVLFDNTVQTYQNDLGKQFKHSKAKAGLDFGLG